MSETSEDPSVRLQALETTLHVEERHPDYDYHSIAIVAAADVFSDVQFTLKNDWERNVELDNQQVIDVDRHGTQPTYRRRCYLRRLKSKSKFGD